VIRRRPASVVMAALVLVAAAGGCGDDEATSSTTTSSPTGSGCAGDLVMVAAASADPDVVIEEGGDVIGLDADGSVRRLTEDGSSFGPSVAPDGDRVVFSAVGAEGEVSDSFGPYGLELYTVAADGSDRQQITEGFGDVDPDWSPDGRQIAFVREGDPDAGVDPPDRIHVVGADGTGEELLVDHDGPDDADPAWSPDGSRLAFVRRTSSTASQTSQVVVVQADGSGAEVVHEAASWVGAPTWSPDGTRLAFPGGTTSQAGVLMVLDLSDGTVTEGLASVDGIDWAPSGRLYGLARPPAVTDFSGRWRLAEIEPDGDGFAAGRAIAAAEPVGYLYTDYRVDVAACTGPGAPALTSEADAPDTIVVTDPVTGADVPVLTREQALALADPVGPAEAMLVFGDDETQAALAAVDPTRTAEIPDDTFVWLVAHDGSLAAYVATTGDHLFAGGGPDRTLPDVPDLAG
jgi:dipeptidyl aminopeptidase/acylaminoacyl peptidase